MSDPTTNVRVQHIRNAGYCGAGMKAWFEAQGFDLRDFVKHGLSEDAFLATGDPMAARVVELKRESDNG